MEESKTERVRIDGVDAFSVSASFIAIEGRGYERKKFTPTSEVSHLEIYQYVSVGGDKFTFVYDTVAKILTVDGKKEALDKLAPLLPSPKSRPANAPKGAGSPQAAAKDADRASDKSAPQKQVVPRTEPSAQPLKQQNNPLRQQKQQNKPSQAAQPKDKQKQQQASQQQLSQQPKDKPAQQPQSKDKPKQATTQNQLQPAVADNKQTKQPKARTNQQSKDKPKQATTANQQPKDKPAKERKAGKAGRTQGAQTKPTAEVGGKAIPQATVKNVSAKRLEWIVKDLAEAGVKVRVSQQDKAKAYSLTRGKDSLEVRREEGGQITLRGTGSLYSEVMTSLESKSNLRLLKKYVPTALRYLSESSKIDLSNGITDLNNIIRLSDYSVLLMAPCRALEKFIYDLEHAQNINVKMIGQAYEKDANGKYSLKKGYLKRIRSVIYPEVMAALYTEYFSTRNFYLHSDNSADSKPRGISDKAEAQRILDRLLSVIEYNSMKLSEIGFTVESEQ